MIAGLVAGTTSLLSVGCIYWSWRERGRTIAALAGWLLALASMIGWSLALGPEFGVTYAIIAFVCLTWIVVFLGTGSRSGEIPGGQRPYQALARPDTSNLLKHGALFLLSVPATGVLTMLLSVAVVIYLPWTMLTKVAVAIFLYPVLWGAISAWICAQGNPTKSAVAIAGLFFISSLLLFI